MPQISQKKIDKIEEVILALLYENPAKPLYTSEIAEEIIRDEEFTLKLLIDLNKKELIELIDKNSDGKKLLKRKKWLLKPQVYSTYKSLSNN